MNTVKRSELTHMKMIAGNEKKYSTVIIDGIVKDWVGIGWVGEYEATDSDRQKYPEMVEDE